MFKDEVMEEIKRLSEMISDLREDFDVINQNDLLAERNDLRTQIETLKIEKARAEEDNARKLREVEHSTGLHRKQSEWERKKAVEEAKIEVEKANLTADRKRFEEQMAFNQAQIKNEIARFESLLTSLMERLPVVKVGMGNGHG